MNLNSGRGSPDDQTVNIKEREREITTYQIHTICMN